MKKLAFIITKSEVGGAQTWVSELYKYLNQYFDIYLIISEKGWLTEGINQPKKTILIPELLSLKKPITILKIANILRENKIDIVISNSASAGIYSRLSRVIYKHKHIYVSHGWSCLYNGGKFSHIFCFIEKILSYFCDTILCVSNKDKENAIQRIGINPKKISVISNRTIPKQQKLVVNKRKKILFIGRMVYPKRPDLLLSISSHFPDMDFFFIGDGPLLEKVSQHYNNYANVFFLGNINNFSAHHEYDIFVLCSDSEGLPMSAIESGSAGLPMILSNVGGCHELIYTENNISNGVLINNNEKDLIDALNTINNNYSDYLHFSQKIRVNYNIENIIQDYINLISK